MFPTLPFRVSIFTNLNQPAYIRDFEMPKNTPYISIDSWLKNSNLVSSIRSFLGHGPLLEICRQLGSHFLRFSTAVSQYSLQNTTASMQHSETTHICSKKWLDGPILPSSSLSPSVSRVLTFHLPCYLHKCKVHVRITTYHRASQHTKCNMQVRITVFQSAVFTSFYCKRGVQCIWCNVQTVALQRRIHLVELHCSVEYIWWNCIAT